MTAGVGPRLRALRRARGLEVRELAQRTGLSRAFVNQIEAGTASPSLKSLNGLAAALDVPVTYLLAGPDEPDGALAGSPNGAGTTAAPTPALGTPAQPMLASVPPLPGSERPTIVRRNQRKSLTYPGAQGRVELLTPDLRRMLEVTLDVDEPGQELPPAHTHDGDTFLLALEGTYEAWIDGERYVLEEGDSIYFSSQLPHTVRLIGDRPGQAIWFSSPPYF